MAPAAHARTAARTGYVHVKGEPSLLERIPELKDDPVLRSVVEALNGSKSQVFTLGCDSRLKVHEERYQYVGYVEFCFNSISKFQEATNYFALFFHFNRMLHIGRERPLAELEDWKRRLCFTWETEGICFVEKGRLTGFSGSVRVETDLFETSERAHEYYEGAMWLLTSLANGPHEEDPIF